MKIQDRREGAAAGHIILISSTAGQRGEAFHADYAVTKGALISLTKSLSSELARDGIYVNCAVTFTPGLGRDGEEMSASALADPVKSQRIVSGIPLLARWHDSDGDRRGRSSFSVFMHSAGWLQVQGGEVVNVNGGARGTWLDEDCESTSGENENRD